MCESCKNHPEVMTCPTCRIPLPGADALMRNIPMEKLARSYFDKMNQLLCRSRLESRSQNRSRSGSYDQLLNPNSKANNERWWQFISLTLDLDNDHNPMTSGSLNDISYDPNIRKSRQEIFGGYSSVLDLSRNELDNPSIWKVAIKSLWSEIIARYRVRKRKLPI